MKTRGGEENIEGWARAGDLYPWFAGGVNPYSSSTHPTRRGPDANATKLKQRIEKEKEKRERPCFLLDQAFARLRTLF